VEVRSAHRTYQSYTFACYRADFRTNRSNIARDRPEIRRSGYRPLYYDGHNRAAVRDAAHGRRASDIIIHNQTAGLAGSHLGVCLGRGTLSRSTGMGTGGDLAVLCILMLIFIMAQAFVVAGGPGNIVCACIPELSAFYRGNCDAVDYRPALRSSSSKGLSFRMAFPRCEMAFFSSLVNWATVLFR
jgi:hypothetical protein